MNLEQELDEEVIQQKRELYVEQKSTEITNHLTDKCATILSYDPRPLRVYTQGKGDPLIHPRTYKQVEEVVTDIKSAFIHAYKAEGCDKKKPMALWIKSAMVTGVGFGAAMFLTASAASLLLLPAGIAAPSVYRKIKGKIDARNERNHEQLPEYTQELGNLYRGIQLERDSEVPGMNNTRAQLYRISGNKRFKKRFDAAEVTLGELDEILEICSTYVDLYEKRENPSLEEIAAIDLPSA